MFASFQAKRHQNYIEWYSICKGWDKEHVFLIQTSPKRSQLHVKSELKNASSQIQSRVRKILTQWRKFPKQWRKWSTRTNVLAYSNALLPWNIPIARRNPPKQSKTFDQTRLNVKLPPI